jgi:pSer/pThr/pTyr-binding forkhead associated (FHA) protein
MPVTVFVRTDTGVPVELTFDGMQPIVVGRGASCDVRLPDTSVSFRHASIRAQGTDFVLVDEGSMNGTFVAGLRVAPRTSRIVRSGDMVRLGRVWIELRLDQRPVTRDVASVTRDAALALVSQALAGAGTDRTTRVRVVEGRDLGATLALEEEGRVYVVGRAAECDLPLADSDASREHAGIVRRGTTVLVRDLGAKNGAWLGGSAVAPERDAVWRPAQVLRIGRTVLAMEEPVTEALARIESAPDEPVVAEEIAPPPVIAPPVQVLSQSVDRGPSTSAPLAAVPERPVPPTKKGSGWSATDLMVMAAALGVLALSIAGLVYLLRP